MSDIKIKVTKEKLQSYLDKALIMKSKAESYIKKHNEELSEEEELHREKLFQLLGDQPTDKYYESYTETDETDEIEEVSFERDEPIPWWMFWKKDVLKCVSRKTPTPFSFVITSDFNIVNWKRERDAVLDHLDDYSSRYLRIKQDVNTDINDLVKAIKEAVGDIEVDPEYLVALDDRYSHISNLYGADYKYSLYFPNRYMGCLLYPTSTHFDIRNGVFKSDFETSSHPYSLVTLSPHSSVMLEKVKKVSKYHNEVRRSPRTIQELIKEAGLQEDSND